MTRIGKLNAVAVTVTAIALFLLWWSLATSLISGSFLGMSDLQIIKKYCRFRLIQPEWLGVNRPDLFFAWVEAEILTRFSLIGAGWLAAMLLLNWKIRKEMKSNKFFQGSLATARHLEK